MYSYIKQYFRSPKLKTIEELPEPTMAARSNNQKRFQTQSQRQNGYQNTGARPKEFKQRINENTTFITFYATAIDEPGDENKKRDQPHDNYLDKYVHTIKYLNLPRTAVSRHFIPQTEFGTEKDGAGGLKRTIHKLKIWKCTYGFNESVDREHLAKFDGRDVEIGHAPYRWIFKLKLTGNDNSDETQKWIISGRSVNWIEDIDSSGVSAELTKIVKHECGLNILGKTKIKSKNLIFIRKIHEKCHFLGKVRMHRSNRDANRGQFTGDFFFKTPKMKELKDAKGAPEILKVDIMKRGWEKPRTMKYHQVLPIKRCDKCGMTTHATEDCDFKPLEIDDKEYDIHAKPLQRKTFAEIAADKRKMTVFYEKAQKNQELMKVRNAIAGYIFAIQDAAADSTEALENKNFSGAKKADVASKAATVITKLVDKLKVILHLEEVGKQQMAILTRATVNAEKIPVEKMESLLAPAKKDQVKLVVQDEDDETEYTIHWDYCLINTILAPNVKATNMKGGKLRTSTISMHDPASFKDAGLADINIVRAIFSGSSVDHLASKLGEDLLEFLVDEVCDKKPDPGRQGHGSVPLKKILATELVVFLIVRDFRRGEYSADGKFDFTGLNKGDGSDKIWNGNDWA